MTIVITMCKLFLAMILGFYLAKKKIFTNEVRAKMSALIVQFTCPCLILSSLSSVPHDDPGMVLKLLLAGVVMYGIFPLIGYAATKIMKVPAHIRGTYICMFIFSNNQFMGFPIVQALFGDVAIFYLCMFNIPFSILFFSVGMHYFRKDSAIEAGTFKGNKEKVSPRTIFNNGLIAAIIAVVLYFANITLPEGFYSVISFIGGITTPLSMIIIGASLAAVSLKEIKTEKGIWPMLPFRLAVIPLVVWLVMHLFTKDISLINICTIGAGMPVASLVAMGSGEFPRQNKAASIGVAISTICSLVTIPIMVVILNGVG